MGWSLRQAGRPADRGDDRYGARSAKGSALEGLLGLSRCGKSHSRGLTSTMSSDDGARIFMACRMMDLLRDGWKVSTTLRTPHLTKVVPEWCSLAAASRDRVLGHMVSIDAVRFVVVSEGVIVLRRSIRPLPRQFRCSASRSSRARRDSVVAAAQPSGETSVRIVSGWRAAVPLFGTLSPTRRPRRRRGARTR